LSGIRYGSYKFSGASPSLDQTFSPQWVANLALSYNVNNGIRFTVGADNVFDSYPDEPILADRYNFNSNNHDLQAPEGGNGGYYYASVTLRY
jgi:iron complex outermembrane recepter protein